MAKVVKRSISGEELFAGIDLHKRRYLYFLPLEANYKI
jgi:hypothetical protein